MLRDVQCQMLVRSIREVTEASEILWGWKIQGSGWGGVREVIFFSRTTKHPGALRPRRNGHQKLNL